MQTRFFPTPADWRAWLERNHESETELWVGFYKKGTGKPSITWPESVDQALCFGWIDGVRKTIDAESYVIRFTPRRRGSIWSNVNIRKVGELIDAGLMQAAGMRAFEARDPVKTGIYSFERTKPAKLPAAVKKVFMANKRAWKFFQSQPPGYRALVTNWVITAKQEATRDRRLATLMKDSAAGLRIAQFRPLEKKSR